VYTPDDSDGPAIKCPGHGPDTACEDYPDGACTACNEKADELSPRPSNHRRNSARDINAALILGAGPRARPVPKFNPYPNGPR